MNLLISFLLIIIPGLRVNAEAKEEPCTCRIEKKFPVPPADNSSLFYIQRTPNTNTIMYDVNLHGGVPDPEEPVHVYWLRYGEQGQKEELSFIQEHYAYGLKTKKLHDKYELRFVSYKKMPFYLTRSSRDDRYRIVATINGAEIEVSRVFLQIEGGSFWLPNVVCVEVKGTDPATGKEITQTFKP
ncbi:DUF4833 domain-containing protein [Fulvivirgaceae bacterium PWU4]|uniref:DUF4833 domain-containing protein n=1 Tax=Chryseosolibacter histidini TaxID=2782349 RepID=A0AAP2GQE3_9BACT|nr:DUF4833 domain-containing protein [Chryseosolibacter histidini]MBT1698437.1 DUF4833 domain-containing protein [Chryseosolibacter histidini]